MSTQIAPLPLAKTVPTKKSASTKKTTTNRSREDGQVGHHARKRPHEHLCTCGRLREDCVRDTVRAVWSAQE
ncbi:MAG: hypothetical protein HOU81_26630 [Hamadaea sp.]|nr:hypothetical protein [Hamadaea sp.]